MNKSGEIPRPVQEVQSADRYAEAATVTRLPGAAMNSVGSIGSDQLERVVRRAATLQRVQGEQESGGLSEDEVIRIGAEVGLSAEYMRRALAEERADSLAPAPPNESRFLAALGGPAWTQVRRVINGAQPSVQRRIEAQFSEREKLKPIRQRQGVSLWEPSTAFLDKLAQDFDFSGNGYHLTKSRTLELRVSEMDAGWSMVSVNADLSKERNNQLMYWGVPGVVLGAALGNWIFVDLQLPALASVPLVVLGAVAVLTAAALGAREMMRRTRETVALRLEGLLDRVDPGSG